MNTVSQSGLYKAPEISDLAPGSPLYGQNVFFIKPYKPGLSIFALLGENVEVTLQLANWDGSIITDMQELHMTALSLNEAFIPVASASGINRYQIFFDSELNVTDFVEPKGQFISPGMLEQLFKEHFKTQELLGKGVLEQSAIDTMSAQHEELILKPSNKMFTNGDSSRPLYARIHQPVAAHS